MTKQIFFAQSEHQEAVNQLRMQEYAKARGFALDLNTLKWKKSDDESYVMVAEKDGRIVSTMRGEFIDDRSLLERKLECPWSYPVDLQMPVLLLSRAATCSSERTTGLNLLLRYWFLRMALAKGVQQVIGTFVTGSPRERSLQEMGYQFFTNSLGWQQSTYRSLSEVRVVLLDLKENGAKALAYCEQRMGPLQQQYSFGEDFPDLRIVRTI